jgi:flagellar motor switch protein FliN/FliY
VRVDTLDAASFLDVEVRLWAELGRVSMPVGRAVALGEGSVVDLDRHPDEPVDVYVNGAHFGTGRLLLVDGEWALELTSVQGVEQASSARSDAA